MPLYYRKDLRKLSDVKIMISVAGKTVGEMESSLEAFDAAKHIIPKRILNKIRNTQSDSVELSFIIGQAESETVGKLDKIKLITWMYENGYFSLIAADMLSEEIEKGTFTIL